MTQKQHKNTIKRQNNSVSSAASTAVFFFSEIQEVWCHPDTVCLVLLDLTPALHTMDHSLQLARLQHRVGFGGSTLEWFNPLWHAEFFCVSLPHCRMMFHRVQYWGSCHFHCIWRECEENAFNLLN